MEMIKVIAMLCSLNTGADSQYLMNSQSRTQLKCQKYYVRCLRKAQNITVGAKDLSQCILEKSK